MLTGEAAEYRTIIPTTSYADGAVDVGFELVSPTGESALISEFTLEEITRRFAGTLPGTGEGGGGTTPGAPVVNLTRFEAIWNGSQVDLSWDVDMEINNGSFVGGQSQLGAGA